MRSREHAAALGLVGEIARVPNSFWSPITECRTEQTTKTLLERKEERKNNLNAIMITSVTSFSGMDKGNNYVKAETAEKLCSLMYDIKK